MKNITIYNPSTGTIINTLAIMSDDFTHGEGEASIEGFYPPNIYHIVDGAPVETVPEAPMIERIRSHRTVYLKNSDWTQGDDSPLTSEKKTEWATYRQALRDLPDTQNGATNFDSVVWPVPPE